NLIRTQLSQIILSKTHLRIHIPPIRAACRPSLSISTLAPLRPGASDMRTKTTIIAIATMLATAPSFGQSAMPAGAATPATRAAAPKPSATSTPELRSAAELALSHEPTFDEGTAQRIREAALSYSDLAVRGGWPTIPADAKFAIGVQGPQDELLRQRLLISG